jgi:hypothetical protein
MTRNEARQQLILQDETALGRPLTAAELQGIDGDLNRACHGGPWISWGGYTIQRMIEGRLFPNRTEAMKFLEAEARDNKGQQEDITRRDAITDQAWANAHR